MISSVNIPISNKWDYPTYEMTLRVNNFDEYDEHINNFASKKRVFIEFKDIEMLLTYVGGKKPFGPVKCQITDDDFQFIQRNKYRLMNPSIIFILNKTNGTIGRAMQFLSTLSNPIIINPPAFLNKSQEEMLNLSERLLFSPLFKNQIQPFFTIFRQLLSHEQVSSYSFWDLFKERQHKDFFIDDTGNVTLSKRWANADLYFGKIDDPFTILNQSKLNESITNYNESLFLKNTRCAICHQFMICQGFLRAIDLNYDCSPMISFLDQITEHSKTLNEQYSSISNENKKRLLKKYDHQPRPKTVQKRSEHPQAKAATILISNQCTNDCIFCAPASKKRPNQEINDDDVVDFIKKCAQKNIKIISFSGAGEPTLNKNLAKYVELAKLLGISHTVIFSNGAKLTTELLKKLEDLQNDEIMISLHGLEEVHNAVTRNTDSYNFAIKALKNIKHSKITLNVNTCLVKENLYQINDLLKLSQENNCKKHSITFPEWSGNVFENAEHLPSYLDVKKALEFVDLKTNKHLVLDNIPLCISPDAFPHVKYDGNILYKESSIEGFIKKSLNGGHNTLTNYCVKNQCSLRTRCAGVDKSYLQNRGDEEFMVLSQEISG